MVCAKAFEILQWLGIVFLGVLAVVVSISNEWLAKVISSGNVNMELTFDGLTVGAVGPDGGIITKAVVLFCIGGMICLPFTAMVFRNLYLILKKATKDGFHPFDKDITRMVREIGIFAIMLPVIELIESIIFRAVLNVEIAEISVNLSGIFFGIVILCLSTVFACGEKLQKDDDGLI